MKNATNWTVRLYRIVLFLICPACVSPPQPPSAIVEENPLPYVAVLHAAVTPAMTASPEDPAWTDVPPIPLQAAQRTPHMYNQTQVQLLWDESFLYVRFRCGDRSIMTPHQGKRDAQLYEGDVVEVFLDPVGDGRQWIELQISPLGDVSDVLILLTAEPASDVNGILLNRVFPAEYWAIWEWDLKPFPVAATIYPRVDAPDFWMVDIAIPAEPVLKRLRLKKWEPRQMRAHFVRYDYNLGEKGMSHHTWNPMVLHGNPHRSPKRMGIVELIGNSSIPTALTETKQD